MVNTKKYEPDYKFYDESAMERFDALSAEGLVSVFLYSRNVLLGNCVKAYDDDDKNVRCVAYGNEMYVPVSFFNKFFGAEFSIKGTEAFFIRGEKSVSAHCRLCLGVLLVPFMSTAQGLGLCAALFYDGRLGVIGTSAQIATLAADREAQNAGAYATLGKYEPYKFTSDDYKAAARKWKQKLVGSPELNDLTSATVREKIEKLTKSAQNFWDSMNKGEDRFILFGDEPPVESIELHKQYRPLAIMAQAWGTYGSALYRNEDLKKDIIDAVEWMYDNMYGQAEIEGRGWRDAHLFNWYFWYISAPEFLTDIFFIMEDCFTLEQKRRYLDCFEWCSTFMRHWYGRETALSRICVCTKVGIACEYPKRLEEEFLDFDMLLELGETGEGPHVDYVQWTHGMPYNNAYGKLNLDRVLHVASSLSGTPLEFTSPKQYNQFMIVKYMFEPAMYKGQPFMMFMGRDNDRRANTHGGVILADMLQMHGMFGEDEDEYIENLVRRNAVENSAVSTLKSSVCFEKCVLVDKILDRPEPDKYIYAHAWYTGDRAAQHGDGYAFGIALSSKREWSWESINGQNKTGWYTGDGATYLYTDYDAYAFDGENFITSNINVAYRYPGTTEDERERVIRSISPSYGWRTHTDFAGSMQLDDKYIVAAMDFESCNFAGPDDHPDDGDYGGSLPIHINDLHAKKSYFCLDGKIVCLGAGITSTMNSPVNTVVEHRRLVNTDKYFQYADIGGVSEKLEGEEYDKVYTGGGAVRMDGHADVLVPDGTRVRVCRYICESANNQPFFEISILHGTNPQDEKYEYVIIPRAEKTEKFNSVSELSVKVVSNTDKLQAVTDSELGLSAAVFHSAGECFGVAVDSPCILALKDTADNTLLSVSDPTRLLDKMVVTLDCAAEALSENEKIKVSELKGKCVITFDTAQANGRKFEVLLKKL